MTVMLASIETFSDLAWFVDPGATNHCTLAAKNLYRKTPYDGHEKLVVGNGTGVEISVIGNSYLSSNSSQFSLNNIIHLQKLQRIFVMCLNSLEIIIMFLSFFLNRVLWNCRLGKDCSKAK